MYLDRNNRDAEIQRVSDDRGVMIAEQQVRDAVIDLENALKSCASKPSHIDRTTTLTWITSMYGRKIR